MNDWFIIVWFVIMIYVIVSNFTDFGRNFHRKMSYGDVIEDYGIIGEEGREKFRLFKCRKEGEEFYLLEVKSTGFGAYRVGSYKLNHETVQNLRTLLR